MSDPNERDSKLVQYMNDAYAKERELESALLGKIETAVKAPYKKRLKKQLKATKGHAKSLERRIKKLGGKGALQEVSVKKAPAAKGGEQEKKLGDATDQYVKAHQKISTYLAWRPSPTRSATARPRSWPPASAATSSARRSPSRDRSSRSPKPSRSRSSPLACARKRKRNGRKKRRKKPPNRKRPRSLKPRKKRAPNRKPRKRKKRRNRKPRKKPLRLNSRGAAPAQSAWSPSISTGSRSSAGSNPRIRP